MASYPTMLVPHLDWVGKHHVVAVAQTVPFIGEVHGLGFTILVGGSRHEDVIARTGSVPLVFPPVPGVAGAWQQVCLMPMGAAIRA